MNTNLLLQIFYRGSELSETEDEDNICIGTTLPIYSPSGVEKVMEYHTQTIDALLQLPLSKLQTTKLLAMRCVTYHEFINVLFDTSIKHKDFSDYPALRCLFLSSDKDRRERIIYSFTKDWHGYEKFLAQMLQPFHNRLFEFLFYEN